MRLPIVLGREKVEFMRSAMATEYESNVRELARLADELGARLILVTQGYTLHYSPECNLNDRWRTYAQERDVVAERYAANGGLILQDVTLLAHSDMMDRLRLVAAETGAILVEGIEALDRDRSQLLSYVHLSPEGNRTVAEAICKAITEARIVEKN
jgi:predicted amidohydrolase